MFLLYSLGHGSNKLPCTMVTFDEIELQRVLFLFPGLGHIVVYIHFFANGLAKVRAHELRID